MNLRAKYLGRPVRVRGSKAFYICPFCEDRRGHLEVLGRLWYCYRCGRGGRLNGRRSHGAASDRRVGTHSTPLAKLDWDEFVAYDERRRSFAWVERWIKRRRLTPAQCRRLRIHVNPRRYALHVIFPLFRDGRVVFYVARSVIPGTSRSYTYPTLAETGGIGKSSVIWKADQPRWPEVVVCEGVLDAVRHPYGVAILGSSASREQMRLIAALRPRKAYAALDGDAPAANSVLAKMLTDALSCPVYRVTLPPDVDPGSLTEEEFEREVAHGLRFS